MNDDFNVRLVVLAALWFAICTLVPIVLILPLILILLRCVVDVWPRLHVALSYTSSPDSPFSLM